jgi:hypothetical protein
MENQFKTITITNEDWEIIIKLLNAYSFNADVKCEITTYIMLEKLIAFCNQFKSVTFTNKNNTHDGIL